MRLVLRASALLLAAAVVAAQPASDWRHWRYSAAIDAGSTSVARLIAIVVPENVSERAAPDWRDLRVVDSTGREVPFVLSARLGGRSSEQRQARLLEPTVVAGKYSEAVLDLGAEGHVHNAVTLHLGGDADVLTWVEIAVSDNRSTWRVVQPQAPIYRVRRNDFGEHLAVSYPDSVARYLRVRILDGSRPYVITGADVTHEIVRAAERVPTTLALTRAPSDQNDSVWIANTPSIPLSGVQFDTSEPAFFRLVSIDVSDDGSHWTRVGAGDIVRRIEGKDFRVSLSLGIPERVAAHWRITVHNRNDAPIADLKPALLTTPRRVVLRQEPEQQYRLLYGEARATAPQYDLARLVEPAALDAAVEVTLAPSTERQDYLDPAPWTERHQIVLWAALAVAVALLGVVAVRAMRT
jgi:hypothetical protein